MTEVYKGHEFKALSLRYQDHVELLRTMTHIDLRIFSGYITLQLAMGAWLATNRPSDFLVQIGLFLIDLVLAGIAAKLLYNNFRRRKEAVGTLKNINEALGYTETGVYLPEKSINVETTFRPWWYWYLVGVFACVAGIALILFGQIN